MLNLPNETAKAIMDAAERFQKKLTRMAARSAEDDGKTEIGVDDVEIALAMLLSRDATKTWSMD